VLKKGKKKKPSHHSSNLESGKIIKDSAINFRISKIWRAKLDIIALRNNTSVSKIARKIVENFLD
jgi:hypothetical protein